MGGWYFDLGRMMFWNRADDTLESNGWCFGCGRMIFTYAKKMIFTSYTYYFWCNALGFNKLLVVGKAFLPTIILLPNLILSAFSRFFFQKKALTGNKTSTHWKGCFHPLETVLLTIGKDASRLWKQIAQIMMKFSLFVMQKVWARCGDKRRADNGE